MQQNNMDLRQAVPYMNAGVYEQNQHALEP